ncbi:hypothetical protein COLO4_19833 [Corchorus olitorius]|uniref:Uncharacterized protein n=1 Tax=Corchorus olitorius TaxID=93759 RepID=A0A1R3J383_9ROSI|nr:hypothetical protein COLO4_19833 [Corchorus olitorius]
MPWSLERAWGEHKAWETLGLRFPIIWALSWPENVDGPWWPAVARGGPHVPPVRPVAWRAGPATEAFGNFHTGLAPSNTGQAPASTGQNTLEALEGSSKVQLRPKCAREV